MIWGPGFLVVAVVAGERTHGPKVRGGSQGGSRGMGPVEFRGSLWAPADKGAQVPGERSSSGYRALSSLPHQRQEGHSKEQKKPNLVQEKASLLEDPSRAPGLPGARQREFAAPLFSLLLRPSNQL